MKPLKWLNLSYQPLHFIIKGTSVSPLMFYWCISFSNPNHCHRQRYRHRFHLHRLNFSISKFVMTFIFMFRRLRFLMFTSPMFLFHWLKHNSSVIHVNVSSSSFTTTLTGNVMSHNEIGYHSTSNI